ncbi:Uncharacterized conserved protein, LabA/DUF88 family [Desulfatibacillum alkenivorans DSM 16219]|jgi:uncharacterized LabA/DUF88 family protein|uniref:Uncharacterized conserved protein, LabA/DUF88 family n=1 Tax=Desulfatibacillum alkenivorans DSM 16219 TaxID=1121393 RepID=A0A1M6YG84_9BACT|nr:NYN domain-containing protein [Desulfatibacillum alkenivorans]SHL17123.1 Uncharacterized conserved protein, LabA/DUF88 family [Desulfatibacillum alkenivorans DSM 16219]
MLGRVRIFIDFWNFQIELNTRTNKKRIDWTQLSPMLVSETEKVTGLSQLKFDGTNVYASINKKNPAEVNLKRWLDSFLDRQTGVNVFVRDRKLNEKSFRCHSCNSDIDRCPGCGEKIFKSIEKGVDSAIVTDMLSLAWADAYDIAVLVSSDADFVPAVENLQERGIKVINATWKNLGHQLAKACWASIELDKIIPHIVRITH